MILEKKITINSVMLNTSPRFRKQTLQFLPECLIEISNSKNFTYSGQKLKSAYLIDIVHNMLLRAKVSKGGKVAIPAACKKALKISDGDELVFNIHENQVIISPLKFTLQKVRKLIKEKNILNESLVDKLIYERRKEADNE